MMVGAGTASGIFKLSKRDGTFSQVDPEPRNNAQLSPPKLLLAALPRDSRPSPVAQKFPEKRPLLRGKPR